MVEPTLSALCGRLVRFEDPLQSGRLAQLPSDVAPAAVLILLAWKTGAKGGEKGWHVLLTVRAQHLRSHPGEVCFPGGKADPTDVSLVHTALRESTEEIGLAADAVQIVAQLPPFRTRANVALCPVIAVLTDRELKRLLESFDFPNMHFTPQPNPDEVDNCFWVPLRRFLTTDGHEVLRMGQFQTHAFTDVMQPVHANPLPIEPAETAVTWGITSFISILLAMIVYERRPAFEFPAFIDQLKFIGPWDWADIVWAVLQQAMQQSSYSGARHKL